jgi:Helix-turn-helix of DDE superfamily endonuclease/Transposase DDE domain
MIVSVAGVITASEPSWIAPFTGLNPRQFGKLVTGLRRGGADPVRRGRPWSLPLDDRVLLVAAYWRTNLTLRQLAPLFGISKSAADRIIGHLGPILALQPRKRFGKDTVLIVDGTLVPTRDHTVAEQSKNYRYSTNHQVVIDADTRLVVAVGRPLPGNRTDCKAWELSGPRMPSAAPRSSLMAATGAPALSSRTAAHAARPNCQPGKRSTTPLTGRFGPASSTPSPA